MSLPINPDLPVTEQSNPKTVDLSSLPTAEILRLINDEDRTVPDAVSVVLPEILRVVEVAVDRLQRGGRLFYVGTGTSGRLGVLDASECPPTFGVSSELVQGIIAGGFDACYKAVEASEDDPLAAKRDLEARGVGSMDVVVGIAASGRTPYTIGAVSYARSVGAFTAAITCVPDSEITRAVDVAVVPVVGPEVVTGSTRMKAGTAQKLVLNMISTAVMVRLGYVSGNRMSNLQPRNEKLRQRAIRIIAQETGLGASEAEKRLNEAEGDLRVALVMIGAGVSQETAVSSLSRSGFVVADAIVSLTGSGKS